MVFFNSLSSGNHLGCRRNHRHGSESCILSFSMFTLFVSLNWLGWDSFEACMLRDQDSNACVEHLVSVLLQSHHQ